MPYALIDHSGTDALTDRCVVSYVVVDSADDAPLGSVVVETLPDGFIAGVWRWNATTLMPEPPTTVDLLATAKAHKEDELRDAAQAWYALNVHSFEGAVVSAKFGRLGQPGLNAEETEVLNTMNALYANLKQKVVQTRAAATLEEVEGIRL